MGISNLNLNPNGGYNSFSKFLNEELKPFAVRILKKDGGHIPIVVSISNDGIDSMNMHTLFEEIDQEPDANIRASGKDLMAKLMYAFVKSRKSFAYVFISECWYANTSKGEDINGEVRQRDDKEEALAFTWEFNRSGTKKTGTTIIPYYRHNDSITVLREVSHESNGSSTAGRFTGILV